jgi:serine/threonine-protein kinase HipA
VSASPSVAISGWKRAISPHGTTATTHILKPQMGMLPNGIDMTHSVENEHFCLKLVSAFGLPAASTEIADFGGRRVLLVERFDRSWTRDRRLLRIPQEDLCQALSVPPSRKYQADGGPSIRDVSVFLQGSDDPDGDRRTFFKTQVVFWLLAAIDGHAKNFSIRLSPGGRFRLTPLYDIMSGQPALDANQIRRNRFKRAMSVGDNRHYVVEQIQPRHFVQSANASGMPADTMQQIFEELLDAAPAAIETTLAHLSAGFPQVIADSIVGGVNARLRVLEGVRA